MSMVPAVKNVALITFVFTGFYRIWDSNYKRSLLNIFAKKKKKNFYHLVFRLIVWDAERTSNFYRRLIHWSKKSSYHSFSIFWTPFIAIYDRKKHHRMNKNFPGSRLRRRHLEYYMCFWLVTSLLSSWCFQRRETGISSILGQRLVIR